MIASTLRSALAPTGKLRIGINHGNPVLASRDSNSGELRGVAVDLARELGRRTELTVEIVPFESAGTMFDAVKVGAWDIAFLAIDPNRAEEVDFAPAYVEIEGTYLVPKDAPYRTVDEVDRAGVHIGVSGKSAYDLFLARTIQHAQLVRATSPNSAFDLIATGKVDVLAGVRQHLEAHAAKDPKWRVFAGRFMAIQQAVGIVKGRGEAVKYLRDFVEDVKASGFVAQAIERAGVRGVSIAPPAAK
ncbi:MAG TPA: ABC transporter substrate-binding protein [Candidatus Binatus sp.]|nr:ABC transporter substrate-binding protein [Candidatus Binatus sp.]